MFAFSFKLTPKSIIFLFFSFLFFSFLFFSFLFFSFLFFSFLFFSFLFFSFLFFSFLFFSIVFYCIVFHVTLFRFILFNFLFSPAMCQQHCPPPFSGSSSHSRTMVRHSRSSAGSVCLAVAVVISCTMVCRNSFLFSALVRTFRKASLRERHMAHTRVPNRGSTGSALHPRDVGFSQTSRFHTGGLEPTVPLCRAV